MFKLFYQPAAFISLLVFPLLLPAQDYEDLNNQAFREKENKNYSKAFDLSTESINKKQNARAYIIRAVSRYYLKDYEAAIDDCTSSLTYYSEYYTEDKERSNIYFWRGLTYQVLERYDKAITDFSSAIYYNYAELKYAYWNSGLCYYSLMKYKESDDNYARAIDRASDSKDLSTLYKYRGDCNSMLGDYDNADKFYTRAISYDADYYNAYWSRGYYRNLNHKSNDAIADYIKASSIIEASGTNAHNDDLASIYRNMALVYNDLAKYDEALQTINKSMLADPNFVKAFETRAAIYQQLKNYDKSKKDYTNAISLVNDDQTISDLYFSRSYKLDWITLDYKTALDDLNKSIALDSKSRMQFWHRAITYDYKKD